MQYIQEITLDLFCPEYTVINAKEADDKAHYVRIYLTENGKQIIPEQGVEAHFRALKKDGNSILNPAQIEESGAVLVELTEQALACPGLVRADVYLDKDNSRISSVTFFIDVSPAPVGKHIDSTNEFADVVNATKNALYAAQKALSAETNVNNALEEIDELETGVSAAEQARREAEETRKEEHTAAMEAAGTATERANTAAAAIEGITVEATPVEPGGAPTADVQDVDGHMHVTFGIPEGEQGKPGVSPTVTVDKVGKTTTITITDADGPHVAEILDGEDGAGNVDSIIKAAALAAHPVGSYYMSNDPTDPTELFGGTWVAIKDKMIMAAGDSFQAGESGGAESTTTSDSSAVNTGSTTVSVASSGGSTTGGTAITIAQMPVHNHGFTGASHSHGILDSEHVIMQAKPALGTAYFLTMTNGSSGTKYEHMIRFSDDTSTAGGKLGPSNMRGTQAATAGGTVANAGSGAAHTHTTPAHTHTLENGAHTHTMSHTHTVDTLPPYIVAYVWQRTA